MSANKNSPDSAHPPRTPVERYASDPRSDPGNLGRQYENYDGPLDWHAYLRREQTDAWLSALSIQPVEVPSPIAKALGPWRTDELREMAEARLVEARLAEEGLVRSSLPNDPELDWLDPPLTDELGRVSEPRPVARAGEPKSRAALEAQAAELGAACKTLDFGLGARVVSSEDRRDRLIELWEQAAERAARASENAGEFDLGSHERQHWLNEAEREGDLAVGTHQQVTEITQELEPLQKRDGSPDRWLKEKGPDAAAALAARVQLQMMRERAAVVADRDGPAADPAPPDQDRSVDAKAMEPPDTGLDFI
jgi:hypothetical protein